VRIAYRFLKSLHVCIRMLFHRIRLASAGRELLVEPGVVLEQAENIFLGDRVRLARRSLLRANSLRSKCLVIGSDTSVMENCVLNTNTGHISIGNNSWLGPGCLLYGNAGLDIGANVLIAGHTVLSTVSHCHDQVDIPINDQGLDCEPIHIEDDVWIGMNVSILKGVRIGRGCIIGAGSVVTKNIPALSVAVGVPARIVGTRDHGSKGMDVNNVIEREVA